MPPFSTRRIVTAALATCWAAASCTTLTDPPLPAGAVRLTPPTVYARWWAMTEACSGLTRDLAAVTWYVVPGVDGIPYGSGPEANGYYSAAGNRIVLAGQAQLDGQVVRHEMLHALLRGQHGHPRGPFLGACAGVVVCADACVRDAGPAPVPPAGTPVVESSRLRVAAELSPAAPSAARDDGWFTLTVTATNPAATPVVVSPGSNTYDVSFSFAIVPDPPRPTTPGQLAPYYAEDVPASDPSVRQFAAGETKRHVFELRVGGGGQGLGDHGIAAGRYTFRGAFGGRDVGPWSTATAVMLSP